jgi:hypothetical protein
VAAPCWRPRFDPFDLWRFLLNTEVADVFAMSRSGRRDDEAAVVSATLVNGVLASAVFSERTTEDIEVEVCGMAGRLRVCCARVEGFAFHPIGTKAASPRSRLRRVPALLAPSPGARQPLERRRLQSLVSSRVAALRRCHRT